MNHRLMFRVSRFVALAQEVIADYYGIHFPSLEVPTLIIGGGKRYLKIISESTGGSIDKPRKRQSIFCFIDLNNGDLLKPASFKAPAKYARGNIFEDDFAIRNVGPFGIAYMNSKREILSPLGKKE